MSGTRTAAPDDVPGPGKVGCKDIRWYLSVIKTQRLRAYNVQSAVAALNGLMHCIKTNDYNQYRSYIAELRKTCGISRPQHFQ